MALDTAVEAILVAMAEQGAPLEELSIEDGRELYRAMSSPSTTQLAQIQDLSCEGVEGDINMRLYTPAGKGPFPVLMYFHGGGWVIGDLDTHDGLCRDLAAETECLVFAVDYHLAPEYPFPAACNDCYDATLWVSQNAARFNGDSMRMAVAGDSAGGNLSAVTSLMIREKGGPKLRFQLLLYPVVDAPSNNASYRENATGYMLTAATMEWFWSHYTGGVGNTEPHIAPLQAESLANLPQALVVTAEYDPLRDEGEAYGRRLKDAGVATEIVRYDGMIHGFVHMNALIPNGRMALTKCVQELRKVLF